MQPTAQIQLYQHSFQDLVLHSRFAEALGTATARYPICRSLRFAARDELDALLDELAVSLGWTPHRLHSDTLMLGGPGLFISGSGTRKLDYASCSFRIWAVNPARAEEARE